MIDMQHILSHRIKLFARNSGIQTFNVEAPEGVSFFICVVCHYGASHLQDLVSGPEPAIFRCCPFLVDFMDDDGPLESEQTTQNISTEQEEGE